MWEDSTQLSRNETSGKKSSDPADLIDYEFLSEQENDHIGRFGGGIELASPSCVGSSVAPDDVSVIARKKSSQERQDDLSMSRYAETPREVLERTDGRLKSS